jgi:hypothetical protein
MAIRWTEQEIDALKEPGMTGQLFHQRFPHRTIVSAIQKAQGLGITVYRYTPALAPAPPETPPETPPEAPAETLDSPEIDLDAMLELADRFTFDGEPTPDQLDELIEAMIEMDSALSGFSPVRDLVAFTPPDPSLPVGIVFTGDWHVGAGGVELDRLRRDLTTIGQTDGLYAVGMGDMIEGVGVANKAAAAMYSGIVNKSDVQIATAVHLARLCGEKWLAITGGNHDAFSYRATGIERAHLIAKRLAAPFFSEGGGTIKVTMANAEYTIGVRHNGKGNSQINTTNAQRRTFDEWPNWENVDVICLAHLHFNDLHVPPRKGGQCVYLRSGTAKTRDSYARDKGYTPEYGMPVVILMPDQKVILPFRGDLFHHALRSLEWERARYRATQAA